MGRARRGARVVLAAAEATFPNLERRLGAAGVRLRRIRLLAFAPRPLPPLMRRWERFGRVDLVLVTSRTAAETFLAAPEVRRRLAREGPPPILAAGPGTASALRRHALRPAWTARRGGTEGLGRPLALAPARRILYPRSARAGPRVAREVRALGHRVLDLAVYDLAPPRRLTVGEARALRAADRVVATSPSAVSALRAGLSARDFAALRRRGLVVLGPRTARAARGHGFRGVRVAPTAAEQGFTRFLLRELRDAR